MREAYYTMKDARAYVRDFPDSTKAQLISKAVEDYHPTKPNKFRTRIANLLDVALAEAVHGTEVDTEEPSVGGVIEAPEDVRRWATGNTFVFTSAQANTILNERFWLNLMKLVEDRGADLHISRFTYNKQRYGQNSVKPGTYEEEDGDSIWFDPRITPYVSDESIQIASDLVWCGELNIIPTRVDPINGFENYGRGASVVIPHTKMAMKSVPTMKDTPARFCYSTGTVTARNYIEKAAGQKASLHHVYGALLVEVDANGVWWARQLNADNEGTIYDLTDKFMLNQLGEPVIERGQRVEVLTHGDLHGNKIDLDVAETMSLAIDALRPRVQVFHDIVDFQPRNHHNINDAHFLHDMEVQGKSSVEDEFRFTGKVMKAMFGRAWSNHYIITSNHDQAIEGWLRNIKPFYDPTNMELWLRLNHYCAQARRNKEKPRPFELLMLEQLRCGASWTVIHEDDSLVIAGIEHGMHGHLGPNGARGSPKNLRSVGKSNTGHTHSAGIVEGVYTAGVFGKLDMGYNKGLSSWSHSFIVTYENGKRTICTIKEGKAWR